MDEVSAQRLAKVHPILAGKVAAMDAKLQAKGVVIRVVQGLRTFSEQNALYAQGRTAPGKIVTNAMAGHSWHNWGFAVDCIPGVRDVSVWTPNWNASHPDFELMIDAGVAEGLISGARWESIKDEPHFQLAGIPASPDPAARAFLAKYSRLHSEDLTQVWAQYESVFEGQA